MTTVLGNNGWVLRAHVNPGRGKLKRSIRTVHGTEKQARLACADLVEQAITDGGRVLWACMFGPPSYDEPIWILTRGHLDQKR